MTQEEKELLLKDLCARLPYETLISIDGNRYRMAEVRNALIGIDTYKTTIDNCNIEQVKPYLFPLSSMTEEQEEKFHDELIELELKALSDEISHIEVAKFEIDYYLKNHFDYRGLIPMGLAIDATNLNIY